MQGFLHNTVSNLNTKFDCIECMQEYVLIMAVMASALDYHVISYYLINTNETNKLKHYTFYSETIQVYH